MDPYTISKDPTWHRYIDGLVILIIGIAFGVIVAQIATYETVTTTTKTIRRTPTVVAPDMQPGQIQAPSGDVKFEEI